MFFSQFWEVFKNTFFTEHVWTTASVATQKLKLNFYWNQETWNQNFRVKKLEHCNSSFFLFYFC